MAKSKFTRVLILGDSTDNVLTSSSVGSAIEEFFQGGAGDDTMTGGRGKDTFVFESNNAGNGTDTIADFQVRQANPNGEYDILDLSKAIGKRIYISSDNISNYVWVEGGNLYVDPQGQKTASTPWAILDGVEAGDQLRVRTGSFDGWITATIKPGPPDYDTIVVGQDSSGSPLYWGDVNEDGLYDAGDVQLGVNGSGQITAGGTAIDYSTKAWTVRFEALNTKEPVVDLAGFASDDKLVIDFKSIRWMGARTTNTSKAGGTLICATAVSAPTRKTSYSSVGKLVWAIKKSNGAPTKPYTGDLYATLNAAKSKLLYSGYFYSSKLSKSWYPTGTFAKNLGITANTQVTVIFPDGL